MSVNSQPRSARRLVPEEPDPGVKYTTWLMRTHRCLNECGIVEAAIAYILAGVTDGQGERLDIVDRHNSTEAAPIQHVPHTAARVGSDNLASGRQGFDEDQGDGLYAAGKNKDIYVAEHGQRILNPAKELDVIKSKYISLLEYPLFLWT